jgi:hypothetical protein
MSDRDLRAALLNGGWQVSQAQSNSSAVKTDAPHGALWDIVAANEARRVPRASRDTAQQDVAGSIADRILARRTGAVERVSFRSAGRPGNRIKHSRLSVAPKKKARVGGK